MNSLFVWRIRVGSLLRWCSSVVRVDVIQEAQNAPSALVKWYRDELQVTLPPLGGTLSNLPLMKSRLKFYRQLGLSSIEFGELVSQTPSLLELNHDANARENLMYLLSLGLSSFLLCNVLIRAPVVVTLSLEAHLKPRVAYFREHLGFSQNEMLRIFEECPEFLQYSVVKDLRFRIQFLMSGGMTIDELSKLVILECPHFLGSTYRREIRPTLEYLRKQTSNHCVKECLVQFPHLMLLSVDQIKQFLEYFRDELKMGRRLFNHMLQNHPRILSLDLERDIKPKIAFLKQLGIDQLQLFKVIVHRPQIFSKSLKEGMAKKIEEMTQMGIPAEMVTSLLINNPKFFS